MEVSGPELLPVKMKSSTSRVSSPCFSTSFLDTKSRRVSSSMLKQLLKDALVYTEKILRIDHLVADNPSADISEEAKVLGKRIAAHITEIRGEYKTVKEEILVEQSENTPYKRMSKKPDAKSGRGEDVNNDGDGCYVPKEKRKRKLEVVPLDMKIRAVALVRLNPHWSSAGSSLGPEATWLLKDEECIREWERQILHGRSKHEKHNIIDKWTYDFYKEAQAERRQVTTRDFQQWALASASQFLCETFQFKATLHWVKTFQSRYLIQQRDTMQHNQKKESALMKEMLDAAETFKNSIRSDVLKFSREFIIYTCHVRCRYGRTPIAAEDKPVSCLPSNADVSETWYVARYSLTMAGTLLPHIFLHFQEPQTTVMKKLTRVCGNVVAVSSGKMTRAQYNLFLKFTMLPYVQSDDFLLIADSCRDQTDVKIYDDVFINDWGDSTCTLKVVPPSCGPLAQPSYVYFQRQVRHFVQKIRDCLYLLENKRDISSREDAIKIHSLLHHQLTAPIFRPMLHYVWFASGFVTERSIFLNVKQVCFSVDTLKNPKCQCGQQPPFIQCSHCRKCFCFPCFYDYFHPKTCITG